MENVNNDVETGQPQEKKKCMHFGIDDDDNRGASIHEGDVSANAKKRKLNERNTSSKARKTFPKEDKQQMATVTPPGERIGSRIPPINPASIPSRLLQGKQKSLFEPATQLNGRPFWDTLGNVRTRGVDFKWLPSTVAATTTISPPSSVDSSCYSLQNSIHHCPDLGRAYYEGFNLQGQTYRAGDCIYIGKTQRYGLKELFWIVATFQATKSFLIEKGNEEIIQKRGHLYMLLVPLSFEGGSTTSCNSRDEKVSFKNLIRKDHYYYDVFPKDILENCSIIQKESSGVKVDPVNRREESLLRCSATEICKCWLTNKWPHHLQIKQIHVINHERTFGSNIKASVRHFRTHDYSSDDSGEFDDLSKKSIHKKAAYQCNAFKVNFRKEYEGEFNLSMKEPIPQLGISGAVEDTPIEIEKKREQYENMMKSIKKIPDQLRQHPQIAACLQTVYKQQEMELRAISPLSDFFDIRASDPNLAKRLRRQLKNMPTFRFRELQGEVSAEVIDPNGSKYVFFLAPCGHGKTKIFEIAALIDGGITLVVEPLKILIRNQVKILSRIDGIDAENLFNMEDSERSSCPRAGLRLKEIVESASTGARRPLILFATPELLEQELVLQQLKVMVKTKVLRRVIVDEFDVIGESTKNSRDAYTKLVPYLSKELPSVRFVYLSGTANRETLLAAVPSRQSKPVLFMTERPLSDTIAFSVERKVNDDQVAKRIESILAYYLQRERVPQCLCYCLTKSNCEKMEKLLNRSGKIKAASVYGDQDGDQKDRNIKHFNAGKIQVLCTNKSMSRGFHSEIPIRYIFHTCLPTSLNDLVQETARGGRDGKVCRAVLFFRPHDAETVKNVVRLRKRPGELNLEGKEKERAQENLRQVIRYCVSQDCRYEVLAEHVRPKELSQHKLPNGVSARLLCSKGSRCDNCSAALGETIGGMKRVDRDVSDFVKQFVEKLESNFAVTEVQAARLFWEVFESRVNCQGKKNSHLLIPLMLDSHGKNNNIRNDLFRVLIELQILSPLTGHERDSRTVSVTSSDSTTKLKNGTLKICVRTYQVPDVPVSTKRTKLRKKYELLEEDDLELLWGRKTNSGSSINPLEATLTGDFLDAPWAEGTNALLCNAPFLMCFELQRLKEKIADRGEKVVEEWAFENVNQFFATESARNPSTLCSKLKQLHSDIGIVGELNECEEILDAASAAGLPVDENAGDKSFAGGSTLFFRARIEPVGEGRLVLLRPEHAFDRRAFRKFGSHRFLHVDAPPELSLKGFTATLRNILEKGLCGRKYGYLWCKATKRPQQYVFFAEKGTGIATIDELTVDQVRNWFLPRACNTSISLEKELKRVKLSFSQTTPAAILPQGVVEVIPDIKGYEDAIQTDGCGLVSTEALDFIWKEYRSYQLKHKQPVPEDTELEEVYSCCPYTSFQARIGCFKGEWVLDPTLEGLKICCRPSQKKYDLPMKCLEEKSRTTAIRQCYELYDPLYDTVDICSWDDSPTVACLSPPVIQILEHRGVREEYFVNLAEKATEKIETILSSNTKLFRHMETKHAAAVKAKGGAVEETENWGLLHRMSGCNLNSNEPVFAQKKSDFIRKEIETMRIKGRYAIDNCFQLRMLPDHTQLLEEGEAFVAIPDQKVQHNLRNSEWVLAMRHPSYFAGDLRKLKLVTKNKLYERAAGKINDNPSPSSSQMASFFDYLKLGIVLSTKGNRSEADKMSGGDYDGDEAWVCWDPDLVDQVSDADAVDTSTREFAVKDPPTKFTEKHSHDYDLLERIRFARHYRYHQSKLGELATLLSRVRDRKGVDSPSARKVATQAFLQVDHPYYLCDLVDDEDTRSLEQMQWPHWNALQQKRGDGTYHSTCVLGKLWDLLGQKISKIDDKSNENDYQSSFEPNKHIIDFINHVSLRDDGFKTKYVNEMKMAAENYDKELSKVMTQGASNENDDQRIKRIWEWRRNYCEKQRQVLILDKPVDQRGFAAAVLYQQTALLAVRKKPVAIPKAFAWYVADDFLLHIVGNAETSHRRGPRLILFEMEPCLYIK